MLEGELSNGIFRWCRNWDESGHLGIKGGGPPVYGTASFSGSQHPLHQQIHQSYLHSLASFYSALPPGFSLCPGFLGSPSKGLPVSVLLHPQSVLNKAAE